MAIDSLEAIQAGGTTQWIRLRGTDPSNPVLLLIQQGPGLPMINETRRFERLLGLEQAFTVIYWDQRGSRRATRQLAAIGPPPHLTTKQFATRVRWATNFGGVTTGETYATLARGLIASLVRSPDYSAGDVIRTVRGVTATQAALLPELATMDLAATVPRLDVPVVMVQGRLDQVAPGAAAQRYASALQSPGKQLVWFENSAHTPHLEEPGKFRDLVMGVRASQLAST